MGNPKYKAGFAFTVHEDALDMPLKWCKPRKIFVNSMSDLFHEFMTDNFLVKCFDVMIKADWHVYQVLTKHPERMASFLKRYRKIPDHIWLGTSVELELYNSRIDALRKIACKMKFVSFEPLLGSVGQVNLKGISWVIVGGESGPNFRPVSKEWIKEIPYQSKQQRVAFFFKQWEGVRPKAGGRILDGKEWNEYPKQNDKNMTLFAKSQ
jgi:protein gp37